MRLKEEIDWENRAGDNCTLTVYLFAFETATPPMVDVSFIRKTGNAEGSL